MLRQHKINALKSASLLSPFSNVKVKNNRVDI